MAELTKEAMNAAYKDYPDVMPEGIENYPFVESRVLPLFYEIPDGAKVLDVGCNSGEFMVLLKEKKGCDVYGVEISEHLVAKCIEKGLNVSKSDAEELPFEDGAFDVVTCMEVLVHLHDPAKALKEMRRVLKPGGVLLGSAPHANLERYMWDDKRLHHAYYDEAQIQELLGGSFERTWLKVLKGAQFNLGWAGNFLAKEPAEILFKSGSTDTPGWDHALHADTRTKVWMGFTQPPGVVYYRMRGYADKMREIGVDIAYENYDPSAEDSPGKWQNKIAPGARIVINELETLLKIAHLSVWQITSSPYVLSFLRAARDLIKKPIITEIDDWLFDIPTYNIASYAYKPNSDVEWIALKQLELSTAIIASTEFIKEQILELMPDKKVFVIPNSIDFDIWDKEEPGPTVGKEAGRIRIGYTGCANHGGDIELIKRPLKAILDEFPNVEFITSGAMRAGAKDEPVVVEHERSYVLNAWAAIDVWPKVAKGWQMDISIAPLRDSNFNRAKSNLRWLEASALKVPTVASRVYPFRHSIRHNEDGLIANSEEQWYEALKGLIQDPGRRTAMGEAAYNRVKADFNMGTIAKDYKAILEEIKSWTEAPSKPKLAVF